MGVDLLHTLGERRDDFRAVARQHPAVRCVLVVSTDESGPCPALERTHLPKIGWMTDQGVWLGGSGGTCGWRVTSERTHRMLGWPLPQEMREGRTIDRPESPWPKPWGFFFPDSPDTEKFFLNFAGDRVALDRYKSFAATTMQQLTAVSIPEPFNAIIENARNLVQFTDDHVLWTILLFEFAWRGVAPVSIQAPRTSWVGKATIPFDEAERAHILLDIANPDEVAAQMIGNKKIPTKWRHFFAELSPDLHLASAEMLSEIITQSSSTRASDVTDTDAEIATEARPGEIHVAILRYLLQRQVRARRVQIADALYSLHGKNPIHDAIAELHDWKFVHAPRNSRKGVSLLDKGRDWIEEYNRSNE